MIEYLNFISIYSKIKKNNEKLKKIKLKYLLKIKKLKEDKKKKYINKYVYNKIVDKIIKTNKKINNEIKINNILINHLKKLKKNC